MYEQICVLIQQSRCDLALDLHLFIRDRRFVMALGIIYLDRCA